MKWSVIDNGVIGFTLVAQTFLWIISGLIHVTTIDVPIKWGIWVRGDSRASPKKKSSVWFLRY